MSETATFRAIIRIDDANMAANVGGAVLTTYRTVVFTSYDLGAALTLTGTYAQAQIVGVEACQDDRALTQGDTNG